MLDKAFNNRMNSNITKRNDNDFVTDLISRQNANMLKTFREVQKEDKKYRDFYYEYNALKFIDDNRNDIYRHAEDPRAEEHQLFLGNLVRNLFPELPEEYAYKNARSLIENVAGDKMDADNIFEVVGKNVKEGIADSWMGIKLYGKSLIGALEESSTMPDELKQKHRDELQKQLEYTKKHQVRTDYYENDYDNFVEQMVLATADFVPSMAMSYAPYLLGATLTAITKIPAFLAIGKGVRAMMAGLMEAGSEATDLLSAGADYTTTSRFATGLGVVNGALEYVGDIPEDMAVEGILNLKKLKNGAGELAKKATRGTISEVLAKGGIKYASGLATEPLTEMLQELNSMYVMNMASAWQERNKGKAFDKEFTYTQEQMADALTKVGLSTLKGQILLGAPLTGIEAFKDARAIGDVRKYSTFDKNSVFVQPSDVSIVGNVKAFAPAKKTVDGVETVDKINHVNLMAVEGKYIPTSAEDMSKAKYITGKTKAGMYANIVTENPVSDVQYADAKAKKSDLYKLAGELPQAMPAFVNEDGVLQVNPEDLSKTINTAIETLGDSYKGIINESTDEVKKYTVFGDKKAYTISSTIDSTATPITTGGLMESIKSIKGNRSIFMEKDFETNLRKEFANAGIEDIDKAVADYTELTKSWSESIKKVAEQVRQANPEQKFENLEEQLTYGMAGLTAKFQSIAGYDSDWAKSHIVIDPEMVSEKDKNGKLRGGTSYWIENGKKVKNPTNRDNAVFHVALSKLMNETTGIHEIAHMSLALSEDKFMKDDYFKTAFYDYLKEDNKGIEDETQWKIGDATHEAFAEKLEAYIETGVADNKQQASLFRRILNAFKALYDKFRGSMTDDQLEFYDRLFGNNENYEVMRAETEENAENDAHYFAEAEETEDEKDAERGQRVEASQAMQILNDIHTNPDLYKNEEGKLLAPNGEVSNYNDYEDSEYLYALVRTENFKRWFGDWENDPENASKVVDENGEPFICHHGTNRDFDAFIATSTGNLGSGNYFFPNREGSEAWANANVIARGGEANVISAFLNIRNPFIMEPELHTWRQAGVENFDRGTAMTEELKSKGYDGVFYYYDGYVQEINAYNANQIKSTDNNGNFNPEDDVFRNQTVHQEEMRKIQEDYVTNQLESGEILPYHEVVRYKDRLDIAMADVLASTIATDGDLQWMQKHLLNVIQDYLGTKTFSWDDISDEDWQKIAKNFMVTAKDDRKKRAEFINDPKAKKKADRDPLDFSKLKTTDNPEKKETDPALVLKRLLAWSMHLTPEQKFNDWLNKFSGKNAKAGDKNIIQLAQRLERRGEFDDKADFDGEALSQRFPFLNRVLKEAYRASDRHYITTKVAEATYLGAQQEIIDNARELWEIDQGVANIYNSRVNKEAVEDTDINAYYNNVTERDLRKARAKADEYRQETEKMQMELDNVLKYSQMVWDRQKDIHDILVNTATNLGIDWTVVNNDKELAELISKRGSEYKADAETQKAVNDALNSDYTEQKAESDAKIQELRIAIGERLANNIALRSMQIASDKEIKRITSELGQKTEALITEKAYSTLMNAELKSVQKKLGDAIVRLDSMREKYNNLGNKYDDAIDKLRQARKEATFYLNEAQKSDNKLKKMNKQSEADLNTITRLTMDLIKQIDKSEKLRQFIELKEDEIENLKVERQVNESKRQWKKKLEQKTGDAILDRALRKFSNVFFQSMKTGEFQPYDILSNPEMFDALSQTEYTYTDKKGIPHTVQVKSVMDILTEAGLAVDGELVKGFNDLELKYFKQMSQALNASRQYSNKLQQKVEQARQANVDKVVNDVIGDIGDLQLSKKDEALAEEYVADGKYNSLKEARQAIYAEKMKYVHEGTGAQKNSKSKMGFNERKGLNPNNNLVFNSFTSLWNMLGSVSKKLRDAFYFGTGKLLGINQLTDEYHRAVDKRTNIPKEAIEKKYGKKNAIQKFMKDAYKKVETRQLRPEDVKGWITKQETWAEIAEDQYNDYDPNYVDNTLTLSEVMAIYEHAKQDADIKHILNGKTNINAWQMAWIVEQFENDNGIFNEYKEIADAFQHGYEEAFDRLQHVANTVYGRALTRYEYYSPARTASSEKDTDISLGFAYDSEGNPVTFGNNKLTPAERAEFEMKTGGSNPINLDYVGSFRSVIQGQEWFINTAEFFKTWNDIMKNEGGGLRKEIEDKFGSGVAQNIIKSMRAVASSEFYDVANGFNRAVDFFRNNMALANLGFSLSSTLQQPAVLAFGFAKFGAKNMFKALSSIKANGGIKEFIKHVHELAPQIKMTGDVNLMYANQALDTNPVFKGIGVLQDVARWGMKGIEALDQFSRCVLWEAGYQKYLKEGMSTEDASVRATQDTMNMNSSRQAKDNSLVYNSKNPLIKMMFLFTNQLNKQWNMLIGEDGLPALKEKRIKEFAGTVLGLAFATTWVLMAKGKFFNNDDEDEKWWEDLWEDYFGEGISMVPWVGEKISAVVNGYAYIDSDLVRSTSTLFKQLMAEDEGRKGQKVRTATKNALVDLSEILGAPKLIVKNTYNALVENGKWKGDEYFTSARYLRQILPYEWYQFVQEKMK